VDIGLGADAFVAVYTMKLANIFIRFISPKTTVSGEPNFFAVNVDLFFRFHVVASKKHAIEST